MVIRRELIEPQSRSGCLQKSPQAFDRCADARVVPGAAIDLVGAYALGLCPKPSGRVMDAAIDQYRIDRDAAIEIEPPRIGEARPIA